MPASEPMEKLQAQVKQGEANAAEQDQRPSGTMFDPETIRKFLDQLKKEDK